LLVLGDPAMAAWAVEEQFALFGPAKQDYSQQEHWYLVVEQQHHQVTFHKRQR
jgi:hypothetical protein